MSLAQALSVARRGAPRNGHPSCRCQHCRRCVLTLSSIHPFIDVGLVVVGFVLGTQGTNVCPAGSVPVGTAEECRSAATAMDQPWNSETALWQQPKGCGIYASGDVYFNTHETGRAHAAATLICAQTSIPSNEPSSIPSNEPTSNANTVAGACSHFHPSIHSLMLGWWSLTVLPDYAPSLCFLTLLKHRA